MNTAVEENRRPKRDADVVDHSDEPPVKKEAEEPASSSEVAELRQQLKQSEEKFQKLCDVARRDKESLKTRVDYLETLVDTKDDILKNASNASVEDELKKKLGEVTNELENERKRSTALQHKLDQIAEALQTPPIIMSGPDLGNVTGSLGSQHLVPSDAYADLPPLQHPSEISEDEVEDEDEEEAEVEVDDEFSRVDWRGICGPPYRKMPSSSPYSLASYLRAQRDAHKLPTPPFLEIHKNKYSKDAKKLIVSTATGSSSGLVALCATPKVKSKIVDERLQGLFITKYIPPGAYIVELSGYVRMEWECFNRYFPCDSWLNERTFVFEKDGEKLLVDARKMGNVARFVRRSCKPNAELKVVMSGKELRVMIKAKDGVELKADQEVTIAFDVDWQKYPRPAMGCTCKGDELKTCEIELFFNKTPQISEDEDEDEEEDEEDEEENDEDDYGGSAFRKGSTSRIMPFRKMTSSSRLNMPTRKESTSRIMPFRKMTLSSRLNPPQGTKEKSKQPAKKN